MKLKNRLKHGYVFKALGTYSTPAISKTGKGTDTEGKSAGQGWYPVSLKGNDMLLHIMVMDKQVCEYILRTFHSKL